MSKKFGGATGVKTAVSGTGAVASTRRNTNPGKYAMPARAALRVTSPANT